MTLNFIGISAFAGLSAQNKRTKRFQVPVIIRIPVIKGGISIPDVRSSGKAVGTYKTPVAFFL